MKDFEGMDMKKYRIRSKFRFTVFMLIMLLAVMTLLGAAAPRTTVNTSKVTYRAVEINDGDTLWEVAEKYAPDAKEIRRFVYEIRNVNSLDTPDLSVGQYILVPIA